MMARMMAHMMARTASLGWFVLLTCPAAICAGQPQWIGRSSCGTATCHGGLIDRGPAWHSSDSLWLAQDPHALAGHVLLNAVSHRIVTGLDPNAAKSAAAFDQVLIQRCVSCHAPSAALAPNLQATPVLAASPTSSADRRDDGARADLRQRLTEGVSCEACHGAASEWSSAHTLVTWDQKGAERFAPEFGMQDTETLSSRTYNCAACHVGSRSHGGLVRDMNHDMIAAGHPPLHFDMWQANSRLPAHWDTTREKLSSVPDESAANVYAELRLRVLTSALRLSEERMTYAKSDFLVDDFVPELSEFDCAACHHVLATNSPRLSRGSTGRALWQPWYTAGQLTAEQRGALHMNAADFGAKLRGLSSQLTANGLPNAARPSLGTTARVRELISSNPFEQTADYSTLPVWLDELDVLIPKSSKLPSNVRAQMKQFVGSRQRLMPTKSDWPLPLSRLMPAPWNMQTAEHTRRQLQEIIAHSANGTQQ